MSFQPSNSHAEDQRCPGSMQHSSRHLALVAGDNVIRCDAGELHVLPDSRPPALLAATAGLPDHVAVRSLQKQHAAAGSYPTALAHAMRLHCDRAGGQVSRQRVAAHASQREGSTLSDTDSGAHCSPAASAFPSRIPWSLTRAVHNAANSGDMARSTAAIATGRCSDADEAHGEGTEEPDDAESDLGEEGWLEGSAITGNELTMCAAAWAQLTHHGHCAIHCRLNAYHGTQCVCSFVFAQQRKLYRLHVP